MQLDRHFTSKKTSAYGDIKIHKTKSEIRNPDVQLC